MYNYFFLKIFSGLNNYKNDFFKIGIKSMSSQINK